MKTMKQQESASGMTDKCKLQNSMYTLNIT